MVLQMLIRKERLASQQVQKVQLVAARQKVERVRHLQSLEGQDEPLMIRALGIVINAPTWTSRLQLHAKCARLVDKSKGLPYRDNNFREMMI